ncbi:CLIC3 protein, partial [Rynchops niger]|nr:CLIC3 protein [Rynchops niger]
TSTRATATAPPASMAEKPQIQLFVKASEDGESVGHCPFCQRLFMVLLLKGVPFTLTTVDVKRCQPGQGGGSVGRRCLGTGTGWQEATAELQGPMPAVGPCPDPAALPPPPAALQRSLLRALLKLDEYLSAPLEHELAHDPHLRASRRRFLDGDQLTLADCNLLPKLNIVQVVCQHYRRFGIPKDLRGVWRYLNSANETKEFKYTCPNSEEIIQAYRSVVRSPQ